MRKARMHVNIPPGLKARAENKAQELGLSLSSYCVLAVAEHLKQAQALDALGEINSLVEKLEKVVPKTSGRTR